MCSICLLNKLKGSVGKGRSVLQSNHGPVSMCTSCNNLIISFFHFHSAQIHFDIGHALIWSTKLLRITVPVPYFLQLSSNTLCIPSSTFVTPAIFNGTCMQQEISVAPSPLLYQRSTVLLCGTVIQTPGQLLWLRRRKLIACSLHLQSYLLWLQFWSFSHKPHNYDHNSAV